MEINLDLKWKKNDDFFMLELLEHETIFILLVLKNAFCMDTGNLWGQADL